MSLDAELAKRSEMRIYTHFTMPDGVHGYIECEFRDSSKATAPISCLRKKLDKCLVIWYNTECVIRHAGVAQR